MFLTKRGVSTIVGYSLLIGIAFIIAVFVYSFLSGIGLSERPECPDGISATIEKAVCNTTDLKIDFKNRGLFTIDGIIIRYGDDSQSILTLPLNKNKELYSEFDRPNPGDNFEFAHTNKANLFSETPTHAIEIQPVVFKDRRMVLCEDSVARRAITCVESECGDGIVESFEECDDGCGGNGCSSQDNGDGCDQYCLRETPVCVPEIILPISPTLDSTEDLFKCLAPVTSGSGEVIASGDGCSNLYSLDWNEFAVNSQSAVTGTNRNYYFVIRNFRGDETNEEPFQVTYNSMALTKTTVAENSYLGPSWQTDSILFKNIDPTRPFKIEIPAVSTYGNVTFSKFAFVPQLACVSNVTKTAGTTDIYTNESCNSYKVSTTSPILLELPSKSLGEYDLKLTYYNTANDVSMRVRCGAEVTRIRKTFTSSDWRDETVKCDFIDSGTQTVEITGSDASASWISLFKC